MLKLLFLSLRKSPTLTPGKWGWGGAESGQVGRWVSLNPMRCFCSSGTTILSSKTAANFVTQTSSDTWPRKGPSGEDSTKARWVLRELQGDGDLSVTPSERQPTLSTLPRGGPVHVLLQHSESTHVGPTWFSVTPE